MAFGFCLGGLQRLFFRRSNLETLYQDGDLKTKHRIIGSIFPKKFVFNGNNYRTARVNEAVALIYNLGLGLSENKNGQADVNLDLSTQVNRIGFELMTCCLEVFSHIFAILKTQANSGFNNSNIPKIRYEIQFCGQIRARIIFKISDSE